MANSVLKRRIGLMRSIVGHRRLGQRGAVGMLFALMLLPMVGFIGLAIDYGFHNQSLMQMDTVADSAALAASRAAAQAYFANPQSNYLDAGKQVGVQWFKANSIGATYATLDAGQPVVDVTQQGSNIVSTVSFSASTPTFFARVFRFNSLHLTGGSSATSPLKSGADFYFMLDTSSSMGIPSDTAGMNQLAAAVRDPNNSSWDHYSDVSGQDNGNCTLACHSYTTSHLRTNPQTHASMVVTDDFFGVSRLYNITLRVDVLSQAVKDAMTYLEQVSSSGTKIRAGVWTFDQKLTQVHALSSSLSDVATSASGIILDYTTIAGPFGDTWANTELTNMNAVLPTAGTSVGSPAEVLFLVTDGVLDDDSGPRVISPISTSTCTKIKNKGVQIYVLWTEYTPMPNSGSYMGSVLPQENAFNMAANPPTPTSSNQVEAALKSCASSSNTFFIATDGSSVQAQMATMVQAAVAAQTRLIH